MRPHHFAVHGGTKPKFVWWFGRDHFNQELCIFRCGRIQSADRAVTRYIRAPGLAFGDWSPGGVVPSRNSSLPSRVCEITAAPHAERPQQMALHEIVKICRANFKVGLVLSALCGI